MSTDSQKARMFGLGDSDSADESAEKAVSDDSERTPQEEVRAHLWSLRDALASFEAGELDSDQRELIELTEAEFDRPADRDKDAASGDESGSDTYQGDRWATKMGL